MNANAQLEPLSTSGEFSVDDEIQQYRVLSASAVAGLVLAALSFLAFFNWVMGIVPVLGMAISFAAIRSIRSRPEELTGLSMARAGLTLSLAMLIGGWGWLGYIYATEVPEGYGRISYADLQPNRQIRGEVIPPSAMELNDKQVFIKGYMYPGPQQFGIQEFVLCRDRGDCCFGGDPKLTDRIKVKLTGGKDTKFRTSLVKVAGTFRVNAEAGSDGLDVVYYTLDADYLK